MRGGTLLILGHGVKGQGQLWHSMYKTLWTGYRLQFQSLSNFTCRLWMMRRRFLLIWVRGSKVKVKLWHSAYKAWCAQYRLQFMSNHFQTSHVGCGWWREKPIDFGSQGYGSRSTLHPLPWEGMSRFALSSFFCLSIRPSVCLVSICLFVCHKNFNLAHTFCSINERALIFGIDVPCDKPFQLASCSNLDLWPTSRSNLLPRRGPKFCEFAYGWFLLKVVTEAEDHDLLVISHHILKDV